MIPIVEINILVENFKMDVKIEILLSKAEILIQSGKKEEAILALTRAAEMGSTVACERLAEGMIMEATTISNDQAFVWAQKAVKLGGSRGYTVLGICYLEGKGTVKDFELARENFKKAAEKGDIKAPRYLGIIYEQGLGVKRSLKSAATYYRKAAEKGDITSQYHMGRFYENGIFVKSDKLTAVQWYEKSAMQGGRVSEPAIEALKRLRKGEM